MSTFKVGDVVERKDGDFYKGELQNKVVDTSKHHTFHDLIIAWAKGAEIEFRDLRGLGEWEKVETPSWFNYCAYRIKPSEPTELEKLEAKYKELGDAIKELKDK